MRKLLFAIQRRFSHKPAWWRAHEDLIPEAPRKRSIICQQCGRPVSEHDPKYAAECISPLIITSKEEK